jgi:hypothetical protein
VETAPNTAYELFQLLQQVSGRLPDESVASARCKLAAGHTVEAAHDIADLFVTHGRLLRRWQCAVLLRSGAPQSVLAKAVQGPDTPSARYRFYRGGEFEPADQAAIRFARADTEVLRLWRAIRAGEDHGPKRVFLAECAPRTDVVALTERLQKVLIAAGELPPRAEVFHEGSDLPPYQRLARDCGHCLWRR